MMICIECGNNMVKCTDPIDATIHGLAVTVKNIEHYRCPGCGEMAFSAEAARKYSMTLTSEYARVNGILSPREIRAVRKNCGLTQKEFEALLGVSSPTASRWETGRMQPSKTANTLMKLIRDVPEAKEALLKQAQEKSTAGSPTEGGTRKVAACSAKPQNKSGQIPALVG